jgi:hypothetical protein
MVLYYQQKIINSNSIMLTWLNVQQKSGKVNNSQNTVASLSSGVKIKMQISQFFSYILACNL